MDSASTGSHTNSKHGLAALHAFHFPHFGDQQKSASRRHHWLSKADEKIEPLYVDAPANAIRQRLELVQAELIQLHSIDLITQSYKCQVYMQFAFRGGTKCPDLSAVSPHPLTWLASLGPS